MLHDDMWDPRTWAADDHEHRIYADETLEVYAVVDAIDYPFLVQWKWSVHTLRVHSTLARKKFYLRRVQTTFFGPDGSPYESIYTGKLVRNRNRITQNVFLHTEVMRRKGTPPPTPDHKIIDHCDRDTMNCRRANLEWQTHKGNSDNRQHRNQYSP